MTNKTPLTFAFPHHDFTDDMLSVARSIYKETRNTLKNTVRFSLKTKTLLINVKTALDNAISNSNNIVFSGHSVYEQQDEINNCGYEPISMSLLSSIISTIVKEYKLPIFTFEELGYVEYKSIIFSYEILPQIIVSYCKKNKKM